MSRIISINKSNYFILSGNSYDNELKLIIKKEFNLEIFHKLMDITFIMYSDYIRRQGRRVIGELVEIIETKHNEKFLDEYLAQDKGKPFPLNYLKFLEFIAYGCSFNKQ